MVTLRLTLLPDFMLKSFLIFFLILFSLPVFSQLPDDYSLKHSLKQDGLSMNFTVLDPDKKGISNHKISKTYYWYKAQHVIHTQGGNSGQLLHGKFEALYSNKQLCEKGSFHKGLKHDEWNYWRADGKLAKIESWRKGKLRGKQYDYDSKGEIYKITIVKWRKAKSNTLDSIVEISGHSRKITVIDSLGKKVSVARFRKGLLHGRQESFSDKKETLRYKNGELITKKEKEASNTEGADQEKKKPFEKIKNIFRKKDDKPEEGKIKKREKAAKEPKTGKTQNSERVKEDQKKNKLFRKKE